MKTVPPIAALLFASIVSAQTVEGILELPPERSSAEILGIAPEQSPIFRTWASCVWANLSGDDAELLRDKVHGRELLPWDRRTADDAVARLMDSRCRRETGELFRSDPGIGESQLERALLLEITEPTRASGGRPDPGPDGR